MACAAALTQQQALQVLNKELELLDLPQISMRIGIHTGSSLTGNIGSKTKMKYGCLGDTKQLAMKLEELCKYYGVGMVCSQQTREATLPGTFFFRELDLVQVTGQAQKTCVYELISRDNLDQDSVSSAGQQNSESDVSKQLSSASKRSKRSMRSIGSCWLARARAQQRKITRWMGGNASEESPVARADSLSQCRDIRQLYEEALGTNRDDVSDELRRQVGLYEAALKAYQEGKFQKAQKLASALLSEKEDPPGRKLLEKATVALAAATSSYLHQFTKDAAHPVVYRARIGDANDGKTLRDMNLYQLADVLIIDRRERNPEPAIKVETCPRADTRVQRGDWVIFHYPRRESHLDPGNWFWCGRQQNAAMLEVQISQFLGVAQERRADDIGKVALEMDSFKFPKHTWGACIGHDRNGSRSLNLRQNFKIKLIGIMRGAEEEGTDPGPEIEWFPGPEAVLRPGDMGLVPRVPNSDGTSESCAARTGMFDDLMEETHCKHRIAGCSAVSL